MSTRKKITVQLIQDAYLDDDGNYTARAKIIVLEDGDGDGDGECQAQAEINVYWDMIFGLSDDQADACDWSSPDGAMLDGYWIADKFNGLGAYTGYTVVYLNTDGSPL